MKNSLKPLCFIALLFYSLGLNAQSLKKGDTSYTKWDNSMVLLRSIYKTDLVKKDTSFASAFLLADHDKLYLVTTKHSITANQVDKNQQLPNDAVTIDFFLRDTGITSNRFFYDIEDLPGKDGKHPSVAFTDDEKDIAIISLQKREYAELVDSLLINGRRPISVALIDTGSNHHADDWLVRFNCGFIDRFETSGGRGVVAIQEYNPLKPFFITKETKTPLTRGNSGAIITANDKMIGMLSDGVDILTNNIRKRADWDWGPAKVTKASYIIACLRKLQQMEADPAFDK